MIVYNVIFAQPDKDIPVESFVFRHFEDALVKFTSLNEEHKTEGYDDEDIDLDSHCAYAGFENGGSLYLWKKELI